MNPTVVVGSGIEGSAAVVYPRSLQAVAGPLAKATAVMEGEGFEEGTLRCGGVVMSGFVGLVEG